MIDIKDAGPIDPSKEFLNLTCYIEQLSQDLARKKKNGEETPICGLFVFVDKTPVGGNENASVTLSGAFMDLEDDIEKDLEMLTAGMAEALKQNAPITAVVTEALSKIMREACRQTCKNKKP